MNITALHRVIIVPLLSSFVTTKELGALDVAFTNRKWRLWFCKALEDDYLNTEGFDKNCTVSYAKWLVTRNVKVRTVTVKQIMNPRLDETVQIFNRLLRLTIHMNSITESILKKCGKTLLSLKLTGSCGSQSNLLNDIIQCSALKALEIGHFSFTSTEPDSTVLLSEERMQLAELSCSSANINEHFLQTLFILSSSITSVNLNGCTQFTDSSLSILCESCPLVSSLSLGKSKITDAGIEQMTKSLVGIIQLDLNRCVALTSVAILAIDRAYRHQLERLNISFCTAVDSIALSAVHTNCRALRSLNITGCKGLSNHSVLHVLQTSNGTMHIQV